MLYMVAISSILHKQCNSKYRLNCTIVTLSESPKNHILQLVCKHTFFKLLLLTINSVVCSLMPDSYLLYFWKVHWDNCWQWNELNCLILHRSWLGWISSDVKITELIAFDNSSTVCPGEFWWSHSCSQWANRTRPISNSKSWANCHWSLQNFIGFSRDWMRTSVGMLFSYSAETYNEKGYREALSDGTWALLSHSRHLWKCLPKEKNPKTEFYLPGMIPETDFKAHGFLKSFLSSTVSVGLNWFDTHWQ